MTSLLDAVLDAHGGADRWERTTTLTAQLSLGGPFWAARGWPDVYAAQTVVVDTHRQQVTFTPFTGPGRTSVLTLNPERIDIVDDKGGTLDSRINPRDSFPLPFDARATPWDAIQIAYFTSCATWNYLTEPFVFTYPGVEVSEVEPWDEHGETWRRLAVTFPSTIGNHNPDQVFYYDDQFLQRRMDYSPDVTGHPPIAHYTDNHKAFDGFVFPTRRRVLLHDTDGNANHDLAVITIHITDIAVDTAASTH